MNSNRKRSSTSRSISPYSFKDTQKTMKKIVFTPKVSKHNYTENTLKNRQNNFINAIYAMPQIEKVKKNKLTISKDKLISINRNFQIENQTMIQYQKRLKNKNFFLNYDTNIFMENIKPDLPSELQDQKCLKNKKVQLLQAIKNNNIKSKLKFLIKKIDSEIATIKVTLPKSKRKVQKKHQKSENKSPLRFDATKILRNLVLSNCQIACDQLQAIVAIKQDKFFEKKRERQPFNLFEVITNPKSVMFQSGFEQLEKLNFNFITGKLVKTHILNIILQRDLSAYSRLSCIEKNLNSIPDYFKLKLKDLFFNKNSLAANNILLIASGQLNHKLALQKLKDDQGYWSFKIIQQVNDQDSIKISYRQNQRNKVINTEGKYDARAEIYYCKGLPKTPQQIQRQKVSAKYLAQMKTLLKQQINILNHNIFSKNLHLKFEQARQEIICKQLVDNFESKIDQKTQHKNKTRVLKQHKDKSESLKLKMVNQNISNKTLKSIKQNFKQASKQKSNPKFNSNSKSKSKPKDK